MTQREMASMGGKARAKALSPARRLEIARKAAAARWPKEQGKVVRGAKS